MNVYIDQKPFHLEESSECRTFEALCQRISQILLEEGKGIRMVQLDGIQIDCACPPSEEKLQRAGKIEITSCMFEEIAAGALRYQQQAAEYLAAECTEFSTDCLLLPPLEAFQKWRSLLGLLKPLIAFIPKFVSLQSFGEGNSPDLTESQLLLRITQIQEMVGAAKQALEKQDTVEFSDIIEFRMVPWLKEYASISLILSQSLMPSHQVA